MANTTYATTTELEPFVSVPAGTQTALLQRYLNAAASVIDRETRNPPQGTEAFSATSAGVVRYFNDVLTDRGSLHIDDCLAVTQIMRGSTIINASYFKLAPYNVLTSGANTSSGYEPFTQVLFRQDIQVPIEVIVSGSWYGYPYPNTGAGQVAITGTWGYCTQANRPAEIKEATLLQAAAMYRKIHIPSKEIMQALRDPFKGLIDEVQLLLSPYTRDNVYF